VVSRVRPTAEVYLAHESCNLEMIAGWHGWYITFRFCVCKASDLCMQMGGQTLGSRLGLKPQDRNWRPSRICESQPRSCDLPLGIHDVRMPRCLLSGNDERVPAGI